MALGRTRHAPLLAPTRPAFVRALALAVVGAAAGMVGACGSPGYHYVKSTADHTFVRVPSDWTLYDEDDILEQSEDSAEVKARFKANTWSIAFDASPRPSLDHLLAPTDHPTGLARVSTIAPSQRDSFTRADLRSLLLPFDPLSDESVLNGKVEVVDAFEVKQGELHGSELLLNLRTEEGDLLKWRQVALVDAGLTKAHILAVSCDDECYTSNEQVIDSIIESWKVTEP